MALSLGQTGTSDSIAADYFVQDHPDFPVRVHMHLDAMDGVARDAAEDPGPTGGLLLGHVEPGRRPVVWIDRYHRVIGDDENHRALEEAAASISRESELSVVGFYRIQTEPGFLMSKADQELVQRYFPDESDLILLVNVSNPAAACFVADGISGVPFPFRGRVAPDDIQPDTARTRLPDPPPPDQPRPDRPRRIVPDFAPGSVQPSSVPSRNLPPLPLASEPAADQGRFRRAWLPLAAALLLVGGALWFLLSPALERRDAAVAVVSPIRPLGLYVDPSGDSWRVSWNPAGTALQGARGVSLFVRDGEDQNRIDLAPNDLKSGTYQYQPKGGDVTFRLEVAEASGHISAESFRFMKTPAAPLAGPQPAPVSSPGQAFSQSPGQASSQNPGQAPRAIRKVPPVVSAGLRPRIQGTIPIDVRVVVNQRGRVTSAVPSARHSGLQAYLADRAVIAAKQWRFEPGVPGSETIHFVFAK